jgi:acyl carrier protein
MGLDSVELVLKVEDVFGLSIPDQDAAGLDTVGKLYDYVLTHRFQGKREACLSTVTFCKLRSGMMSALQIPRTSVRVSTELSTLIPDRRRRMWRSLQEATGLHLPELKRPFWVTLLGTVATIGLTIVALRLLGLGLSIRTVMVAIFSPFPIGLIFYWLTTPLAFRFRPDCATVDQLAKATLAQNFAAVSDACDRSNAEELWDSLRHIIAEELGVRANDLKRETNFVKDLGVD